MKTLTVLWAMVFSMTAMAGELAKVNVPDEVTVEGKSLKLNGMGLRTKTIFRVKVYVASLYLENKSNTPAEIMGRDEVRKVDMHMLRDLEKAKIVEAFKEGVEKNNPGKMGALKERFDQFVAVIPDLKEGQSISIIYVPGKGTRIEGKNVGQFTAPGKDFADALFSVWLGSSPVDEDLKKGMLGK
jgi:Chalcone isomerase-like